MARRSSKDPAKLKAAAKLLCEGAPYKEVYEAAGYPPSMARYGKAELPKAIINQAAQMAMEKHADFKELGKKFSPDDVESIIEGRLAYNTIMGKQEGESSAKLWGSMKKHQLFQADSMTGVIVLQVPNLAPAGKPLLVADSRDLLDTSPILDADDTP